MSIDSIINIGERGLWRFYDEVFTKWSRQKLASLFSNIDLENPEIQRELKLLESQGFIKIIGEEDLYLEVIKAP